MTIATPNVISKKVVLNCAASLRWMNSRPSQLNGGPANPGTIEPTMPTSTIIMANVMNSMFIMCCPPLLVCRQAFVAYIAVL